MKNVWLVLAVGLGLALLSQIIVTLSAIRDSIDLKRRPPQGNGRAHGLGRW